MLPVYLRMHAYEVGDWHLTRWQPLVPVGRRSSLIWPRFGQDCTQGGGASVWHTAHVKGAHVIAVHAQDVHKMRPCSRTGYWPASAAPEAQGAGVERQSRGGLPSFCGALGSSRMALLPDLTPKSNRPALSERVSAAASSACCMPGANAKLHAGLSTGMQGQMCCRRTWAWVFAPDSGHTRRRTEVAACWVKPPAQHAGREALSRHFMRLLPAMCRMRPAAVPQRTPGTAPPTWASSPPAQMTVITQRWVRCPDHAKGQPARGRALSSVHRLTPLEAPCAASVGTARDVLIVSPVGWCRICSQRRRHHLRSSILGRVRW